MKTLFLLAAFLVTIPSFAQCGEANTTTVHVAPNYLTQTSPAKGAPTYTDPQYGCQIIKVTDGLNDYVIGTLGFIHEYIMSPINSNDTYLITNTTGNAIDIRNIPAGTIVHPYTDVNLPNDNNMPRWRRDDPDKFIYFSGNTIQQYSVAGDNSTTIHTFAEYTAVNFGGSHSSIASSTKYIGMTGQLPAGNWESFAFDYVNNIKKTPAALQPTNPTGVTVSVTANSGTSSIVLAKTGGTGDTGCSGLQQGSCQFTVAGDATVYTETLSPTLPAGGTATFTVTPNFAVNENAGAAVVMLWKPNDLRIVGDANLFTSSSGGGAFQLYDINMTLLNTVSGLFVGWPHSDSGIDPANGHPTLYLDASNDSGSPPCGGSVAGLDKIDMTTGSRSCLLAFSFSVGGHYSLTADGKWLFIHTTNSVVNNTTCFNADLPGNWATLWGKFYNEMILIKTDGTAYYRQGYHYSRLYPPPGGGCSSFYYNFSPRVAISYDGKYGVFDSNFDTTPATVSGALFTDVFILATGIPQSVPAAPSKLGVLLMAKNKERQYEKTTHSKRTFSTNVALSFSQSAGYAPH
jgi:hypothetical protein